MTGPAYSYGDVVVLERRRIRVVLDKPVHSGEAFLQRLRTHGKKAIFDITDEELLEYVEFESVEGLDAND